MTTMWEKLSLEGKIVIKDKLTDPHKSNNVERKGKTENLVMILS
jgi:hypothetical protein